MNTIITKTIECIPDISKIEDGLYELVKQKFEFTCSKKYGYILEVLEIVSIRSCKISIYNGSTLVQCDIRVRCLLPKVGQKMTGDVLKVYTQGIKCIVSNCLKIFIPTNSKVKFTQGESIPIQITQIRFQKGKYDCIASIDPTGGSVPMYF